MHAFSQSFCSNTQSLTHIVVVLFVFRNSSCYFPFRRANMLWQLGSVDIYARLYVDGDWLTFHIYLVVLIEILLAFTTHFLLIDQLADFYQNCLAYSKVHSGDKCFYHFQVTLLFNERVFQLALWMSQPYQLPSGQISNKWTYFMMSLFEHWFILTPNELQFFTSDPEGCLSSGGISSISVGHDAKANSVYADLNSIWNVDNQASELCVCNIETIMGISDSSQHMLTPQPCRQLTELIFTIFCRLYEEADPVLYEIVQVRSVNLYDHYGFSWTFWTSYYSKCLYTSLIHSVWYFSVLIDFLYIYYRRVGEPEPVLEWTLSEEIKNRFLSLFIIYRSWLVCTESELFFYNETVGALEVQWFYILLV